MTRDITRLSKGQYDVLVVGGGINGAAAAHMAALNGLKVALIEKNDFASGTSSKSTKLIHGGLRYLENFEFDLVYESLHERALLLKSAPHLVKPLKFIIPVYKKDARPFWVMRLGVWLYDRLSGRKHIGQHRRISIHDVVKAIPQINRDGLLGGLIYYDAQMNDARLCLENVLSAQERGAHVANYVEARSFIYENGKAVGVLVQDVLTKKVFEMRAKKVMCTLGPWTNRLRSQESGQMPNKIRTTKGVHLVYAETFSQEAIFLTTQKDRRIFFVIPWQGHSLIGTTDTDYQGNPDRVNIEEEDTQYLLSHLRRFFPQTEFSEEKIITTFAGLRPLVYSEGNPSSVSRKDLIEESYSGVIYVMGGKYTTFRRIAEAAIRKISKREPVSTKEYFPVYGSGQIIETSSAIAAKHNLDAALVQHLIDFYGIRYTDVMTLIDKNPTLKEPLCSCSPAVKAQVIYAIQNELAMRAEDIIERRLGLQWTGCKTQHCRREIQKILDSR